jgi:hypothetical protein
MDRSTLADQSLLFVHGAAAPSTFDGRPEDSKCSVRAPIARSQATLPELYLSCGRSMLVEPVHSELVALEAVATEVVIIVGEDDQRVRAP